MLPTGKTAVIKYLLDGKLTVKCPKTDTEVNVRKTCTECPHFKHISWKGLKPIIACTYGEETKKK